MKLDFINVALLAVAGMALSTSAISAATTAATDGDLLMGFRVTSGANPGASNYLVVNLGQYSALTPGALSLGNLGADLSAAFGNNWNTRTDLAWGIIGTDESASDVFGSKAETVYGTQAAAYQNKPFGATAQGVNAAQDLYVGYQGRTSTANSTVALVESSADINNWGAKMPTLAGYFQPTLEGSFGASGTGASALDLFRTSATDFGAPAKSVYTGTFTISNTGVVSYNTAPPAVAAVPEPGRAMLLACGLTGVMLRRRRK